MQFKNGDRVSYDVDKADGCNNRTRDQLGTVLWTEAYGDGTHVLWDGEKAPTCHVSAWLLLRDETKVLKAPPLPPVSLFPDTQASKETYPMWDGLMAYFPAALAAVANVSYIGSRQHQPDLPTQWARDKSKNHKDKILRHLLEGDVSELDTDGTLHAAKVAWRSLANLQILLEARGAPIAPAATNLETSHDPK